MSGFDSLRTSRSRDQAVSYWLMPCPQAQLRFEALSQQAGRGLHGSTLPLHITLYSDRLDHEDKIIDCLSQVAMGRGPILLTPSAIEAGSLFTKSLILTMPSTRLKFGGGAVHLKLLHCLVHATLAQVCSLIATSKVCRVLVLYGNMRSGNSLKLPGDGTIAKAFAEKAFMDKIGDVLRTIHSESSERSKVPAVALSKTPKGKATSGKGDKNEASACGAEKKEAAIVKQGTKMKKKSSS